MPNYTESKIYKILNTIDNEVYVGSTIEPLSKRMYKHRHDSERRPQYKLYEHMQRLGKSNFYIELIETYPCKSKEELLAKEGEWIRNIATLNDRVAGRNKKQWETDNHDRRMQQAKEYREAHKEERKQYDKQRYENDKEEMNKHIRETIICECGASVSRGNILRHRNSPKHAKLMNMITE